MREVKLLSSEDYDEVFSLSQYAFQYVLSEEALLKKKKEAQRHTIWGIMDQQKIAAKLHLIPLSVYINGKPFEMGGIAAVASWPEYRRKGMIKDLLLHALQHMKAKGQTVSYLHPFSVPFYRKYGWEIAFSEKTYTIPMDNLKNHWDANGYVRRVDKDIALLHTIYSQFAKKYNGPLTRDGKWWEQRVLKKNEKVAVAYNDYGQSEGYLIYEVKENVFKVEEITYHSLNALKLLLQFLTNHDSMAKHVEMVVPENDNIPLLIGEPRFTQKMEPYFMARIVDVLAFLQQYVYHELNRNISIPLHVEDDFLPGNSGLYTLDLEGGAMNITFQPKAEKTSNMIHCSVQQLAVIFLGYKRPTELYKLGLIQGNENAVENLEHIIPWKQTYFPDFF